MIGRKIQYNETFENARAEDSGWSRRSETGGRGSEVL
jgi:hypothetical protein